MDLEDEVLSKVRAVCLALPEATERETWGLPTFRIGDRMFAVYANNLHNDGRIALWCASEPDLKEFRMASDPDLFFSPPYMGPRGWVALHVDRCDDLTLTETVRDAYKRIAPKRLQKRLTDEPG